MHSCIQMQVQTDLETCRYRYIVRPFFRSSVVSEAYIHTVKTSKKVSLQWLDVVGCRIFFSFSFLYFFVLFCACFFFFIGWWLVDLVK